MLLSQKLSNPKLIDTVELSKIKCTHPIKAKLKYATSKNFVGRIINGYDPQIKNTALMTPLAAERLCEVHQYLIDTYGFGLLIYDAYRPKRAVEDFVFWAKQTSSGPYEEARKRKHYPHIEKPQLFELNYVAEDSGHCYGNTVDLILFDIRSGRKLNMGACYDFMGEKSHTKGREVTEEKLGPEAFRNRKILSDAMQKFGFHPYDEEFWHFSYRGKEGRETQMPLDIPIAEAIRCISPS
ncbi:MAG: D-alanyl-D-alanine dipeptidase [Gammaproteobacteria bacterium]|jgi:D-alanyl-D-alanine dipeptidase|nr:D-alanyl-D-alanine dipeptidase [Gammaproteobacteria bacterium]